MSRFASPLLRTAAVAVAVCLSGAAAAQVVQPQVASRAAAEQSQTPQSPPAQEPQDPTAPRTRRPAGALFGPRVGEPQGPQSLELTILAFGAHDDNVLSEQAGGQVADPRYQVSGAFGGASVAADYSKRWRRVSFGAEGGSSFRYYPSLTQLTGTTHNASLRLAVALGQRTNLRLNQGAWYAPYFSFGVFDETGATGLTDQTASAGANQALNSNPALTTHTQFNLDRQLSQRSSLAFEGTLRRVDLSSGWNDLREYRVGGRYRRNLTPHTGLRLGYFYREGDLGGSYTSPSPPFATHDLDLGVDYNRPLGETQRTTLAFSGGSTIVRMEDNTYYRVLGSAALSREIGQSWGLTLSYRRALQLIQGLDQPYYADAVSFSAGGYIGTRVDIRGAVQYAYGDLGFAVAASIMSTASGSLRVRWALTSNLALYSDYVYYQYSFKGDVTLPTGVLPRFHRQGLRAGITVWVPVLR